MLSGELAYPGHANYRSVYAVSHQMLAAFEERDVMGDLHRHHFVVRAYLNGFFECSHRALSGVLGLSGVLDHS